MRSVLVAANSAYVHTNPGITQIAAYACARGQDVICYETHIGVPVMAAYRDILALAPDVIGFSCYIWNREYLLKLAHALRRATGAKIVFGGPEAAMDAPAFLADAHIDHVITGEGEEAFADFLEGKPSPAPRAEMASWPEGYPEGVRADDGRIYYAETSRGCPFRCAFCLSGRAGSVRALPAEEALRRLRRFSDAGVPLVKLIDRTFNFDAPRARVIWEGLMADARKDAKTRWHFEIVAELLGEEDMALLEQAPPNLFQFEIGVQTTTESVLKNINRRNSLEDLQKVMRRLGAVLPVHLDLIAGLPGETVESFAQSFNAIYALGPNRLQLGFLKLLHGSALRRDAERWGLLYCPDPPYEILRTEDMDARALSFLHDVEHALDWYYNDGLARLLLRELVPEDAYGFFRDLALHMREAGAFSRSLSYTDKLGHLFAFACTRYDRQSAALLLWKDILARNPKQPLPDWLRDCIQEKPTRHQAGRHFFLERYGDLLFREGMWTALDY